MSKLYKILFLPYILVISGILLFLYFMYLGAMLLLITSPIGILSTIIILALALNLKNKFKRFNRYILMTTIFSIVIGSNIHYLYSLQELIIKSDCASGDALIMYILQAFPTSLVIIATLSNFFPKYPYFMQTIILANFIHIAFFLIYTYFLLKNIENKNPDKSQK